MCRMVAPWRTPLVRNADASLEIGKSGIGTNGIEAWVDLQVDQHIGVLAEGLLERLERLIILAQADVISAYAYTRNCVDLLFPHG